MNELLQIFTAFGAMMGGAPATAASEKPKAAIVREVTSKKVQKKASISK